MVGGTSEQVEHDKMYHMDYSANPISAEEMIERSNRKERGLLLYNNCKIAELKTFIRARDLKMPVANRAKKAEFIAILEAADEVPEFSRFLGLPAEIRELIYSHRVRDLPTPLPELAFQPPLTLVSKQIRQESLPVFHSEATFMLQFGTNAGSRGLRNGVHCLYTICLPSAVCLQKGISDQALSRIRKLHVQVSIPGTNYNDIAVATWQVDLNSAEKPEIGEMKPWESSDYWAARQMPIYEAIQGVLVEMWNRPKSSKIRRADVGILRQALHVALQQ